MLDETSDLLESPIAGDALRTMLDSGFGLLVEDKVGDAVFRKEGAKKDGEADREAGEGVPKIEVSEASANGKEKEPLMEAKLASVLAVMTREAGVVGGKAPNEYLQVCSSGLRVTDWE